MSGNSGMNVLKGGSNVVCGQAIATGTLYITLGTILACTDTIMGTGTNVDDTG